MPSQIGGHLVLARKSQPADCPLQVRYLACVNRCLYCLAASSATFVGTEHVVPQAFGLFGNNPTLNGCVCDACNASLGRDLDLYFARDTPEGLLRFSFGIQDPADYKHVGKRSTMTTRPVTGRWAGATTWQKEHDGQLMPFVAPQVGFATTREGPFTWFPRDNLPTRAQILEMFGTSGGSVELIGIGQGDDNSAEIGAVKEDLRRLGVVFADGPDLRTMERGVQPNVDRIEHAAKLGPLFFRCIAKISVNYIAYVCGPEYLYGAAFDPIRRFISGGSLDERLVTAIGQGPSDPVRRVGDSYRIGFRRRLGGLQGHVRLLTGWVWAKQLTFEPDGIPMAAATHDYDLDSMTARRRYPPLY